jgi:hypothetical protein
MGHSPHRSSGGTFVRDFAGIRVWALRRALDSGNATIALAEARELDFTVAEIAEKLQLTPQAANNRLAHLVRSGALSRARIIPARGGREFRYELPVSPGDTTSLVTP